MCDVACVLVDGVRFSIQALNAARGWSLPSRKQVLVEFDPQHIERAIDGLVDYLSDGLRPVIKRGDRWHDAGAHFSHLAKQS